IDRIEVAQMISERLVSGHLIQIAKQAVHADVQAAERRFDDVETHCRRELARDGIRKSHRGVGALRSRVGVLRSGDARRDERGGRECDQPKSREPQAPAEWDHCVLVFGWPAVPPTTPSTHDRLWYYDSHMRPLAKADGSGPASRYAGCPTGRREDALATSA